MGIGMTRAFLSVSAFGMDFSPMRIEPPLGGTWTLIRRERAVYMPKYPSKLVEHENSASHKELPMWLESRTMHLPPTIASSPKTPLSLRGAPAHLRTHIRRKQNAIAARKSRARRKARHLAMSKRHAAGQEMLRALQQRLAQLEGLALENGLISPNAISISETTAEGKSSFERTESKYATPSMVQPATLNKENLVAGFVEGAAASPMTSGGHINRSHPDVIISEILNVLQGSNHPPRYSTLLSPRSDENRGDNGFTWHPELY